MGPRSNLLSQKTGRKSRDTVPLRVGSIILFRKFFLIVKSVQLSSQLLFLYSWKPGVTEKTPQLPRFHRKELLMQNWILDFQSRSNKCRFVEVKPWLIRLAVSLSLLGKSQSFHENFKSGRSRDTGSVVAVHLRQIFTHEKSAVGNAKTVFYLNKHSWMF